MQLIDLSKTRSTQLFWAMCGFVIAIMILTGKQQDPGVAAAGALLAIVSLFPFYLWMLGWSHGLPIWPVFAAMNGVLAALPMVQAPETLDAYSPAEIIIGGLTLVGFILLGSLFWLAVTGQRNPSPATVLMISREHSERYLFAFIAAGLFFQANQQLWWVPLPGNTMQIVRGVAMSLNSMGIFVLSYYAGRGLLGRGQIIALVCLSALTAAVIASNLILASAIVPVALLFLGYILGSGKMPWKALALAVGVLVVLQPGKYAMRDLYWGGQQTTAPVLVLPMFYWNWFGYGFEELGKAGAQTEEEEKATSLFKRAGNIHMLLLVQKKSPDEVPFLNGITYEQIPRLMVPRLIDSEKGSAHAGNILLTVNYGVQSIEVAMGGTSIGWGLVPEAYANFGYLGVGGLAVFLGLFYGYFTRLSSGVPMTSLRFVIGLLIMAAATRADTMGLFITSQFQAIVGVSLAAVMLMRRQTNPLAAQTDGEAIRQTAVGTRPQTVDGMIGTRDDRYQVGPAKWGGHKPPKWAPLSHRKAYELAAARRKAEAATEVVDEKNVDEAKGPRPRQVAVPIQPYYYRSRKA